MKVDKKEIWLINLYGPNQDDPITTKSAPLLVRAAIDVTVFLAIAAPFLIFPFVLSCFIHTWFSFHNHTACIQSSVPFHVFVCNCLLVNGLCSRVILLYSCSVFYGHLDVMLCLFFDQNKSVPLYSTLLSCS